MSEKGGKSFPRVIRLQRGAVMPNRHVVPHGKQWVVKAPGNPEPISTHRTQGNAEKAAKKDIKGIGGQVIVHRPSGEIRDADTVKPANDPNPPRDAKH